MPEGAAALRGCRCCPCGPRARLRGRRCPRRGVCTERVKMLQSSISHVSILGALPNRKFSMTAISQTLAKANVSSAVVRLVVFLSRTGEQVLRGTDLLYCKFNHYVDY
ncbi:hypothetical protein JEQ12_018646 [Ovis aries]|uniref:Uncharacterized protein n=1 Tax=Ovis aries TaxID=9940 RepID=A0A836D318_SHEEP|nr:hypothetical protein JEQ12_018646 [Ovis aries]